MSGPGADRNPDFAGDYNLQSIILVNSVGEELPLPLGLIMELNVFEDININALTGSAHLIDANNVISQASLQGNERLIFKLSTPGNLDTRIDTVDASVETGYPFHIYALTDRKQVSETSMSYTLHFCSRELLRNVRTRVSKAYNGGLANAVVNILRDENGLSSRKRVVFEETRNQDKIVVPNMRPFDAINMIARKALSKNAKGAGYYFYETTKGFHFRSYESMLASKGKHARDELVTLLYTPKTIGHPNNRKFINQHSVESFEFMQHFDTLAQQATGTYASRIITHNMYDKSYNIKDYNYHAHYSDMFHVDQLGNSSKRNYPISDTPVDIDPKDAPEMGDKTVSNYPNSAVILQGSTRFLHGENTGIFGTSTDSEGLTEAIRMSQQNQVENSVRLKVVIPGHSYLQVGDVVNFRLPSMEPNKGEKQGYQYDEYFSGRYLITKLRHRAIRGEYKMVLELIKDSVYKKYINLSNENYPGKQSIKGPIENIYDLDEFSSFNEYDPSFEGNP